MSEIKEIAEAFEHVTTRNVIAIKDHANVTRELTRECEKKVATLELKIIQQDQKLAEIRQLLSVLQAAFYSKGTN